MRPARAPSDPRPAGRLLERLAREEGGSATLEFVTAGLILLLPLVYLILTMSALQSSALAAEGAARQAARVFVRSESTADAESSAERAIQFALADHGVQRATTTVAVHCEPAPQACLTRRGFVTVSVSIDVPLPLAPVGFSGAAPLSVPITAQATQQVSRFWTGQ
jgi:Flp pilus assembly protein TadG